MAELEPFCEEQQSQKSLDAAGLSSSHNQHLVKIISAKQSPTGY